jgi:hypothetical protein
MSSSESESESSSGSGSSSEEDSPQVVAKPTKGKRKAPEKGEKKIKRPLTAYMFFSKEQRPLLKAANPELGFGAIGKLVGENWRNLADNKKGKYQKQTDLDKERYEREKKEHPELVAVTKSKNPRAAKKLQLGPKKPLTSYMFYMQQERPSVISDHPEYKFSDIGKEVGRRWKALDSDEKQTFQKQADEAKAKYKIDFETWKEDHPDEFELMQEQKKKPKGPAKKKQKVEAASGSESDSESESSSESDSD